LVLGTGPVQQESPAVAEKVK